MIAQPRFPQFRHLAAFLPVAALIVPLSILLLMGWMSWRAVWTAAELDMRRAAGSAAEYGQRSLVSYGLAAGRINDRLMAYSDSEIANNSSVLRQELQRIKDELTQGDRAFVLDSAGHELLVSDRAAAVRGDSLFRSDRGEPAYRSVSGLSISRTYIDPVDRRLTFAVTRPRRAPGERSAVGQARGVVGIAVNPHVLASGLERLLAQPTDRMAFIRTDGYGLSTTSGLLDQQQPLPRVADSSPFYAVAKSGADSGLYVSGTAMAGEQALLAMRRIDGFPVYAVSIRAKSVIISRWWQDMATQIAFALPATVALFLLSLKVWRDQRRLLRSTEVALAESAARLLLAQEAADIGAWEWDAHRRKIKCSPSVTELLRVDGTDEVGLREMLQGVKSADRPILRTFIRSMRDHGEGRCEFRVCVPLRGQMSLELWLAARGRVVRTPGSFPRVMGVVFDISDRKRAEERTALMSHEVEHRAKNVLTIVASLLRLTKASTAEELVERVESRIHSLGRTLGLLSQKGWQGASLGDLIAAELETFQHHDGQISLTGPVVILPPDVAQPVSMVLHELATNAAKYGGLSVPEGHVSVEWNDDHGQVAIHWTEKGGPRVQSAPSRNGFGSRLITMLFERQIGGKVDRRWEQTGLVCDLVFPLTRRTPE